MFFKWIDKMVEDYCEKKFQEAKTEVDEHVKGQLALNAKRIAEMLNSAKAKTEQEVIDVELTVSEGVGKITEDLKKRLEASSLDDEIAKFISDYVHDGDILKNPVLLDTDEGKAKAIREYNLKFMTVASFSAEGYSHAKGLSNSEVSDISFGHAMYETSTKAIECGKNLGADLVFVDTKEWHKTSWGPHKNDSKYYQVRGDGTMNAMFYKIESRKDLPIEVSKNDDNSEKTDNETDNEISIISMD